MPTKQSLCQLEVGSDSLYYLLTTTHDEGTRGFDLALCDGIKAWTGSVTDEDLEILSHKMKMTVDEYISQTHKALTAQNISGFHFQYQIKPAASGAIQFIWKKNVPAENIKFQLGSLTLGAADSPVDIIQDIFKFSINATQELNERINTLKADNERLNTERTQALKRLEKYVTAKEELENHLYSKFVVVVNEKKSRIRNLKEEVEEARADIPSTSNTKCLSRPVVESDEEADTDVDDEPDHEQHSDLDTDEEKVTPPKRSRQMLKTEKKPTQISQNDSLQLDMGDEAEEEEVKPTGRRRHRQISAKKAQTPSRPVIPKGSARTPKNSSQSQKTSLKKSMSDNSNRSSDNIDMDALMDDF